MNPSDISYEVADIFNIGFTKFVNKYGPLPKHYYSAANAIMNCQTEKLGGHKYRCDSCEHELTLYNSCRNRHCPKCQAMARAKWVKDRIDEVLNVKYFHIVFTIPHQLNPFVLRNKRLFYNLMFKAVSETLIKLGKDPKRLGGKVGFISLLHTWGQNLMDHPHLHCVIPGGAISNDNDKWIPSNDKYLFPVAVLRKLFRGKFMDLFTKALKKGSVKNLQFLKDETKEIKQIINKLYSIDWVVYVKAPFATPEAVIKYLGNYTHRIAISNKRILKIENDKVTFSHKDYADNSKKKEMTISIMEFIRRFMMHVLPEGLKRIRHYGFLSNKSKKKMLPIIKKILDQDDNKSTTTPWDKVIESLTEKDKNLCPKCNKGKLISYETIEPVRVCLKMGHNH